MTKVIVLGDLHAGARNSNKIVEHWQERFFKEIFWPYVDKHNIKRVIQLGDVYDNRKWLNINTVAWFEKEFVQPALQRGVQIDLIIGNHDIPYRNTLENNSPSQLLSHFEHINVWDHCGTFSIDDVNFTMVPWICKENYDECMEAITKGGDICVGHFDIYGFEMHAGTVNHDQGSLKANDFSGWNRVWTGHYHTQSHTGNISYLGTPYQMSWNDYSNKSGFWVFDTHDRSETFVNNPFNYFHRLEWNDGCNSSLEHIHNSYVKLTIKKKSDFESFENFLDKINFNNPYELKIIESFEEFNSENITDLIQMSSTEELIDDYIDDVATNIDKEKVKLMMHEIYKTALVLEDN